jgi:hypothetical protein
MASIRVVCQSRSVSVLTKPSALRFTPSAVAPSSEKKSSRCRLMD